MKNITRLLYIEWIKISRKISTWLMLGLYAFFSFIVFSIFKNFTINIDEEQSMQAADVFSFDFEVVWVISAFLVSYLIWFLVMIIVSITADDLRHNIWRQHLIEGLSRFQLLSSKVIIIMILAAISTLVLATVAAFAMYQHSISYDASMTGSVGMVMLKFYLYTVGFLLTGLLITQFVKSTGFTIIIMLGWVWIAEPIIRYLDKSEITQYAFANSFNDLIHNPITEAAGFTGFQLSEPVAIAGSCIWIAVFLVLSWWKMSKSDL